MSEWSAEELRRAALEALGDHGDERARDTLAHATVTIDAGVTRWDSSAGTVEAHRVTLGIDARTFGTLRAAPSLVDALVSAVAAAISSRPLESLHHLGLSWEPGARPLAVGYRDGPPAAAAESLGEAVLAYLEGNGDGTFARTLAPLDIDATSTPDVVVHTARPEVLRKNPYALHVLTCALRDLLGEPGVRVRAR